MPDHDPQHVAEIARGLTMRQARILREDDAIYGQRFAANARMDGGLGMWRTVWDKGHVLGETFCQSPLGRDIAVHLESEAE